MRPDEPAAHQVQVGEWLYDRQTSVLSKDGQRRRLKSRVADTLAYLIDHKSQVVSKEQLMQDVWETVVSDNTITRVIAQLRQELGDDPHDPQYIITVQLKGYRFVAPCAPVIDTAGGSQRRPFAARRNATILLLLALALISAIFISHKVADKQSIPAASAKLERLTSLPGDETDPTLSPDAKLLAFSHRPINEDWWNIYIRPLDNENYIQVTDSEFNDRLPSWSADGSKLVFKRVAKDHCEIFSVTISPNLQRFPEDKLLNCDPSAIYAGVAWDSAGEAIYFANSESSQKPMNLYRQNLMTAKLTQLTSPPDTGRGDYRFALSPDGECLAFLRNINNDGGTELWCYRIKTAETTLLHRFVEKILHITWAADSQTIYYPDAQGQINRLDIIDGQALRLTQSQHPLFYPASKGELLVAGRGSLYKQEIWILEADLQQQPLSITGNQRWISSSHSDHLPRVRPDNGSVAFISTRSGFSQIWIKAEQREYQLSRFTQAHIIRAMEWSRSGDRLLVLADGRLCWVEADSGEHHYVAIELGTVANPVWGHDNEILFAARVNDEWQIMTLDLETGKVRQVSGHGGYKINIGRDGTQYISKLHQPGLYQRPPGAIAGDPESDLIAIDDYLVAEWRFRDNPNTIYFTPSEYQSTLYKQQIDTDVQQQLLLDIGQDLMLSFDVSPGQDAIYYSRFRRDQTDIIQIQAID